MKTVAVWGEKNIFDKIRPLAERLAADDGCTLLDGDLRSIPSADCVLICTEGYTDDDIRPLLDAGTDRETMVFWEVLTLEGFSFSRYRRLVRSRPSILSNNCTAGNLCRTFRLPFLSPTIGLFLTDPDYLVFLENLDEMLKAEPVFERTNHNPDDDYDYPVFRLRDVRLNMYHYRDPGKALAAWKRRRERINRGNLLVILQTDDPALAERFDRLPYPKKIGFVPFRTDLPSCVSVDPAAQSVGPLINGAAAGFYRLYDLWTLLEEGRAEFYPDQLRDARRILLYGAGAKGRAVYDAIRKRCPGRCMGFAVSSMEENEKELCGLPVRTVAEWKARLQQDRIPPDQVLTVLSLRKEYYPEAAACLRTAGFSNICPGLPVSSAEDPDQWCSV